MKKLAVTALAASILAGSVTAGAATPLRNGARTGEAEGASDTAMMAGLAAVASAVSIVAIGAGGDENPASA